MSDVIRVQVVDDHRVVRRAISRLLNMEPDVEVVGEAVDELGALKQVEALAPDVVLMDVSMPRLQGLEITRRVAA